MMDSERNHIKKCKQYNKLKPKYLVIYKHFLMFEVSKEKKKKQI